MLRVGGYSLVGGCFVVIGFCVVKFGRKIIYICRREVSFLILEIVLLFGVYFWFGLKRCFVGGMYLCFSYLVGILRVVVFCCFWFYLYFYLGVVRERFVEM